MILRSLATLLPVLVVAWPAALAAEPRSSADCERLKNDLAYNQCLANFGPAAKNIAGGGGKALPPPPADTAALTGVPGVEEPELRNDRRRSRRGRWSRRGGRQSMSFDVAGAGSEAIGGGEQASSERRSSRRWRYRSRRR